MATQAAKAPCVHCRTEIEVPDAYAHGDHITCGACRTRHKVSRSEGLRLVLADIAPLQEQLDANRQLVSRLEAELQTARGSLGIGSVGFGIAVVYTLWQVILRDQPWSVGLIVQGIVIALLTGGALEIANYLFLTKRQNMMRIGAEIEEARREGARLRQLLRDSSRV